MTPRPLAFFWLFFFFILPLLYVLVLSFLTKGTYGGVEWVWTFKSFERTLTFQYGEIFLRTVLMALVTAFFCTILGSLCAWFVVSKTDGSRDFWLMIFVCPFLLNSLIRLYALQGFVGVSGPLQGLLRLFLKDYVSVAWTHNQVLMYGGLILTYLPFTVLPLTAAFEKWDRTYYEAACDLGATTWQGVVQIIWPLLRPQFALSFFMVLIPCLGEYLVPEILGGSQKLYWGQLIAEAYLKWRDWPMGSVLGLVLIVMILLFFVGVKMAEGKRRWT